MPWAYIGPLAHLKGKTALCRNTPEEGWVAAQFDDRTLTLSGKPIPRRSKAKPFELPHDALAYGWHAFKRSDFEVTA